MTVLGKQRGSQWTTQVPDILKEHLYDMGEAELPFSDSGIDSPSKTCLLPVCQKNRFPENVHGLPVSSTCNQRLKLNLGPNNLCNKQASNSKR